MKMGDYGIRAILLAAAIFAPCASAATPKPDLDALLQKGRFAQLRDAARSLEIKNRRTYWFPTSIVDSQTALRRVPENEASALRQSADLLLKIKRLDLAEAAYRKALAGHIDRVERVELLHGLAAAQFLHNGGEDIVSYRRSRDTFKRAAADGEPDSELRALSEHGVCFSEWHVWVYGGKPAGGPAEAFAACSRALKLKPRPQISAKILETLASAHMDAGDRKSGILYLDQAYSQLKAAAQRERSDASLQSELSRLKGRIAREKGTP